MKAATKNSFLFRHEDKILWVAITLVLLGYFVRVDLLNTCFTAGGAVLYSVLIVAKSKQIFDHYFNR